MVIPAFVGEGVIRGLRSFGKVENRLIPLQNHGVKTMSMGYLLRKLVRLLRRREVTASLLIDDLKNPSSQHK